MNVLITYGGTKEPIDKVRYIGNISSGRTGEAIASHFISHGATVTCLKASSVNDLPTAAKNRSYFSFDDLQTSLLEELHQTAYDVIIHAAAVSDYRVTSVTNNQDDAVAVGGKIRSGQKLQLILEPTPKLISKIKDVSKNKKALLVGFKLTESASPQERMDAVYNIFDIGAAIVVQNDLSEMSDETHPCQIFISMQNSVKTNTKKQLAETLYNLVKERL
jgi:phosphopantothenoylcysteine synthetase/decarboxylase